MTLPVQIFWGSFYLGLSCLIHVAIIAFTINRLWHRYAGAAGPTFVRLLTVLLACFMIVALSHTIHVWLWAWALIGIEPLSDWNSAVYFSLLTYTSLGYGDIVLGEGARIFGAFASVTGLLTFGVGTAFLAAVLSRLLHNWLNE